MAKLDLKGKRDPHEITVDDGEGGDKTLLLPKEATVKERERMIEKEKELEDFTDTPLDEFDEEENEDTLQKKVIERYKELLLGQLLILFRRHHSDLTLEDLKVYMTLKEAEETIRFFNRNRVFQPEESEDGKGDELKKKVKENSSDTSEE